jgi:hypothetical protein
MNLQNNPFLDFLFEYIGSCQLQDLSEEELADFAKVLFENWDIKKK